MENHTATVQAINKNAPEVKSITAPEGTYYPGQVVPVTVTFDEPVNLSTVQVVVNGKTLSADSTGYSNVATVAYEVPANYGTTVNVSSITAKDSAGNAMDPYNPGGETSAEGKELEDVTMAALPSASVEGVAAELGGTLAAPQVTLSVQLTTDPNAVQWLNEYWNGDNTFDTDGIALRQVGADGEGELITLSLPRDEGAENPLAGKTLTATVSLPPNKNADPLTTTFELLVKNNTVLGKTATVEQRGFTPIKEGDFHAVIDISETDDLYSPFYQFENESNPVIYMQDNPYIEIYGYTDDGDYSFPYGGIEGGVATTFKMENGEYVKDDSGKMVPVSDEADYGVYLTNPSVAQLEVVTESTGRVKLTPLTSGETGVKIVVFNAGLDEWVEFDASYLKGTKYTLKFSGGLTPLLNMAEKMSVPAYQDATVYWTSNLWDKDPSTVFNVTVKEDGRNEIYSTTLSSATAAPTRCTIPADKLEPGQTYTVTVSARYDGMIPEATTELTVEKPNLTVTLKNPTSFYVTDDVGSMTFGWSVTSKGGDFNMSSVPFSFTVTGDDGQLLGTAVTNAAAGSATVTIPKVVPSETDPNSYRDVYTVTAQVTNGDETSLSYDSFLLYVYSKDALDIVVQDAETGAQTPTTDGQSLTLNNNDVNPGNTGWSSDWQQNIIAMNRDIHLKEVISVNYGTYAWNEVADQIQWKSEDSSVASIDYKQGAVYENIENFEFTTYRPTSDFLLAGHADGTTTLTATHNLLKDLSDSVNVQVETLKNKLYLFQCYPQGETTLTFKEYTNASKTATKDVTITSDENGAAAYYAQYGIASDVTCSTKIDSIQYYGTFYKDSLKSGEPDAARMGLYPCNNLELRRAAYADLYVKNPDGTPYTGKIVFRGGVYVNDEYQEDAKFHLNETGTDEGLANNKENGITVDLSGTNGRLEIAMDITRWSSGTNPIATGDQISYVF
ncbi:fibronectin type III domain-containing protein [Evtepia sp.]